MMDSKVDFESADGVKITVQNPEHYTPSEKGGDESIQGGDKGVNGAPGGDGQEPPRTRADEQIARTIESKGPIGKTQQQKLDHSYSQLKRQARERESALKARIEELEKQLASKPDKKDFSDEDKYLDARMDYRDAQRELAGARKELETNGDNVNLQIFAERARSLYPNQESQAVYKQAYSMGLQNGAVDAVFGDKSIRDFIHDSELGPRLLEHFCRKPDVLQSLLDMSEARKSYELVSLEKRLYKFLQGQQGGQQKTNPVQKQVQVQAPVVGAPTNKGSSGSVGDKNRFGSDEDVFKYLRNH